MVHQKWFDVVRIIQHDPDHVVHMGNCQGERLENSRQQAATCMAAELVQRDDIDILALGGCADIVAMQGNPFENITARSGPGNKKVFMACLPQGPMDIRYP